MAYTGKESTDGADRCGGGDGTTGARAGLLDAQGMRDMREGVCGAELRHVCVQAAPREEMALLLLVGLLPAGGGDCSERMNGISMIGF